MANSESAGEPRRACVAGIEVNVFGQAEHAGRPVVFVTHGRGGRVADTFDTCRRLAGRGLVAVAVEQRNHGRRLVDPTANGSSPFLAVDMYGIIVGTATDIRLLLDFLPDYQGLDPARFYPPALAATVDACDPIRHPERFADRPLLMTNGDADRLVPMECNRRFEAADRPHYTHPERLRLSVYPGVGHATPPEMLREADDWLVTHLLDGVPG